jgi:hypothetical protein
MRHFHIHGFPSKTVSAEILLLNLTSCLAADKKTLYLLVRKPRDMDPKHTRVSLLLLVDGIVLLILAFIHLLSTPIISKGLARELTIDVLQQADPPFLLNHLMIGILLIPFGVSTLYIAAGVRTGQPFARWIAMINALGVLILPSIVGLLGGPQYYNTTPFLLAAILITIIGVSMFIPLIWLNEQTPRR